MLADESEAARRTLLRGRFRARRRSDAHWQFAFCAPECRVRNAGLLFTCYRGKTTRLVPACDLERENPAISPPRPAGIDRLWHTFVGRWKSFRFGSPWNVQENGQFLPSGCSRRVKKTALWQRLSLAGFAETNLFGGPERINGGGGQCKTGKGERGKTGRKEG